MKGTVRRILVAVAMAGITGSMAAPAVAVTIYDTTYAWDGSSQICCLAGTTAIGQTFIAPNTDNILEKFTFYMQNTGGTIQLQAEVYSWSGSLLSGNPTQGATGSALFTSAPITVGFTGGVDTVPVTATTGGTVLTPGGHYIALFSTFGPDPTDITNSLLVDRL